MEGGQTQTEVLGVEVEVLVVTNSHERTGPGRHTSRRLSVESGVWRGRHGHNLLITRLECHSGQHWGGEPHSPSLNIPPVI